MSAQEEFDALPSHFVKVSVESIVYNWLAGRWAYPNHPATVCNPNGVKGFKITEVKIEPDGDLPFGRIFVRGENTMWFGQNSFKVDVL